MARAEAGPAAFKKLMKKKEPTDERTPPKKLSELNVLGKHRVVKVENLDPNPWNPNHLSPSDMKKLIVGIREVREQAGSIPPIIVRENPDHEGRYQIIDGEHRWRVFKNEKWEEMDAFVIKADDGLAKKLTLNLNYLRGEPNEKQEADLLASLIKEGYSPGQLAETLYLDEDTIIDKLAAYEQNSALSDIFAQEAEKDGKEEEKDELGDESLFIDLNFKVSVGQAKVIEKELKRISDRLNGKNARGRALEMMAVNSSNEPLQEV